MLVENKSCTTSKHLFDLMGRNKKRAHFFVAIIYFAEEYDSLNDTRQYNEIAIER